MNKQDIKQLVIDAAQRRRAIKFFDPEQKISKEDINYILEIARLSPQLRRRPGLALCGSAEA